MSSSKNLEYEKTSFLNKSNSAFIEQMYLKFINKDADLPDSWKDYFEGIGDELNTIANEINGHSWGPKKNKVNIDELQKKIDKEDADSISNNLSIKTIHVNSSRSNEDSIKAVSMIRSYRQRGHLIAKLEICKRSFKTTTSCSVDKETSYEEKITIYVSYSDC